MDYKMETILGMLEMGCGHGLEHSHQNIRVPPTPCHWQQVKPVSINQ